MLLVILLIAIANFFIGTFIPRSSTSEDTYRGFTGYNGILMYILYYTCDVCANGNDHQKLLNFTQNVLFLCSASVEAIPGFPLTLSVVTLKEVRTLGFCVVAWRQ